MEEKVGIGEYAQSFGQRAVEGVAGPRARTRARCGVVEGEKPDGARSDVSVKNGKSKLYENLREVDCRETVAP